MVDPDLRTTLDTSDAAAGILCDRSDSVLAQSRVEHRGLGAHTGNAAACSVKMPPTPSWYSTAARADGHADGSIAISLAVVFGKTDRFLSDATRS